MAATFNQNLKFFLAILTLAISGFWFNMESYQKDRVLTVVVRSAVDLVDSASNSEFIEDRGSESES